MTIELDADLLVDSGNQMGDLGARMLSKALQINKKLVSVKWDQNGTSAAGFQYIASALEKWVSFCVISLLLSFISLCR